MSMGGGKGGGGTSTHGGISPEQQALAQYTFGENVIGDRQKFSQAGSQMGPSTNLSLAVAGSRFGEAKQAAEMSDKDFAAMQRFNEQQASALENAAGQAGQLIGGLAGGGGGGGGGGAV